LGTKVEVKNLNSFRSVERAIAYEIERQIKLIESGGEVVQETRGWDENKQQTFHQRFKEGSADYRYFPEPDLPKLYCAEIEEFSREALRASLPELPWEKRRRWMQEFGLKEEAAELLMQEVELGIFFEKVVIGKAAEFVQLAVNYITSDLIALVREREHTLFERVDHFIKLIDMVMAGELSSRGAKDVLRIMVIEGGDPEHIAQERGLMQIHDEKALTAAVEVVLAREEKAIVEYRAGKLSALQYLVGKAMQESKGAGNPQELQKIIKERLL
jgi:aspartyl-tRNA(Asn)/glutamyl-tRNA(Gln) amidotransferase subunit B